MERIRASLSRSPFCFLDSTVPLPEDEVDMYVAPVDVAVEILRPREEPYGLARKSGAGTAPPASLVPVIAFGPAGLMRSAFVSGVADYLREPWGPEELELRAARVFKEVRQKMEFPWGTVALDGRCVETGAGSASLTLHESKILRSLILNRGAPVCREALAYWIWGRPGPRGREGQARGAGLRGSRAIDVHVASIRRKLETLIPGPFIKAVRNEGYIVE